MPKRISDRTRIINFAMTADEGEINHTIETLRAIAANRFPKARAVSTTKPKKQKRAIGVQTNIDDIIDAGPPIQPQKQNGKADKFVPDPDVLRMVEESKAERGEAAP